MDIFYVVLHYQNMIDTHNCITSILKQKLSNEVRIHIVVVDNCSPNNSGRELKEYFQKNNNIYFIINEYNGGFAYGNNIGYKYAKKKGADYIIVTNNDTIFYDDTFTMKLANVKSKSSIIAPNIVNLDGYSQNPVRQGIMSRKDCIKLIIKNNLKIIALSIPYINKYAMRIIRERTLKWYKDYYENFDRSNIIKDFVPFGATIIFSRNWIEREDFAFIPKTFMYFEEDFLALYSLRSGHTIELRKELCLRHLEGKSIEASSKSDIEKNIKRNRMINDSINRYIKYLKENA